MGERVVLPDALPRHTATVQILLSSYNGEAFLSEQLRSLDEQTYPNLELLVRDDGSTDGTLATLRAYRPRIPIEVRAGEHVGLPATYFELLRSSSDDAEMFAFCDQDDVWLPDKIKRAVEALSQTASGRPALYCGRTRYVDRDLRPIGLSELPRRRPSFQGALLQNVASGCTIVMNRAARDLLVQEIPEDVFMHDSWAYLVVSAFGEILYDREPMILYRQHGANTIGGRKRWIQRLGSLLSHGWSWSHFRQAAEFRRIHGVRLEGADRKALDRLLDSRARLRDRVRYALTADVRRPTLADDLAFRLLFITSGCR